MSPSGLTHAVRAEDVFTTSLDANRHEVTVRFRGRPVLAYAYAATPFKPYVRELYSLRGENVVRDAPPDHLHHHGLMFALRVNDVNFWEERPPAGRQTPDGLPVVSARRGAEGLPEATIRQTLRWQPPDNDAPGAALLVEERTLRLTANPGLEEVALSWESRFQAGPGASKVTLTGAEYNGLGMRLPEAFDHVAVFQNSGALPYSEAQTFDVRPARWTSSAGRIDGRELMVAMGAAPQNPGPSHFFTMRNAFAYLAGTQNWGKTPQVFERGQSFTLRYLVLVYPAHQNAGFLDQRFGAWARR